MFRSLFLAIALCCALLCTVSAMPIADESIETLARRLASRPETGEMLFQRKALGVSAGLQPRQRVGYRTDQPENKRCESTAQIQDVVRSTGC